MLPVEGNGEEDDSEAQEKSKYSKENDNKDERDHNRSNANELNSNRRHVGIKPLALHTSTTSTDDFPLSSSGGSTASSITDVEKAGRFSKAERSRYHGRHFSSLPVKNGGRENQKDKRSNAASKQVLSIQSSNSSSENKNNNRIIQQTLI